MAIAIINPPTGQLEEDFAPHTNADVESRIAEAQAAFEALPGVLHRLHGGLDVTLHDVLADLCHKH